MEGSIEESDCVVGSVGDLGQEEVVVGEVHAAVGPVDCLVEVERTAAVNVG